MLKSLSPNEMTNLPTGQAGSEQQVTIKKKIR